MSNIRHYGKHIDVSKSLRLTGGGLEPRAPFIFDHFTAGAGAMNSQVPQNWVTTEAGTGTPFAVGATGISVAIGATGGTTDNAEELAGKGVNWNPSLLGGLTVEARFKVVGATTATDGDFYFGLADAVTYTASLPYVVSAASALTTSVPSNFAGFAYTSIATSGALYLSGGNPVGIVTTKADTNIVTAPTSNVVVKDSNYHIYRIECDASANCAFYIDDKPIGGIGVAFTANTAMTPYLCVVSKNSRVVTCTLDWFSIAAGNYSAT